MLIKILGILDFLTALIFLINNYFDSAGTWFPNKIVFVAAIYLLIKGIFFVLLADIASVLDIICAGILLASVYTHIPALIAMIVIIFLAQKAFFSVVS